MLLYLDHENNDEIQVYIHSNGGAVSGLTQIYDVMMMINSPIKTVCLGKCYSAGAVLLAAGDKGNRYAFKNSSIMVHSIQFGFPIPGTDVISSQSYYDYINSNNDNIMKILSKHTGHPLSKLKADCKEDFWMTPEEAIKYNLIDHII